MSSSSISMKCPKCGLECNSEGVKETIFGNYWEFKCKCDFVWRTLKE